MPCTGCRCPRAPVGGLRTQSRAKATARAHNRRGRHRCHNGPRCGTVRPVEINLPQQNLAAGRKAASLHRPVRGFIQGKSYRGQCISFPQNMRSCTEFCGAKSRTRRPNSCSMRRTWCRWWHSARRTQDTWIGGRGGQGCMIGSGSAAQQLGLGGQGLRAGLVGPRLSHGMHLRLPLEAVTGKPRGRKGIATQHMRRWPRA